jgi:hypothetical protein
MNEPRCQKIRKAARASHKKRIRGGNQQHESLNGGAKILLKLDQMDTKGKHFGPSDSKT